MKIHINLKPTPFGLVMATTISFALVYAASMWLESMALVNQALPALLFLVCGWAAYTMVNRDPLALWTPLPWFLVASAVYFGFGPLIYHFGSPESIDFADSYYAISEYDLARTNMLNVIGIALLLGGFVLGSRLFHRARDMSSRPFRYPLMRRLMWTFLAIGVSIQFLFVLPNRLGLLTWTLPGAIQFLSDLSKIAIILLFVLVGQGYRRYRLMLIALIGFELVVAIMSFSKLAVIEVFITVGLGWYLVRPDIRRLMLGGVLVILLYVFVLSPFVTFGRLAFGTLGVGTVGEVAEAVGEYGATRRDDLAGFRPGVQGWWTRFSYSNAQAFAMHDHDRGAGGETVKLAFYAFVPRLLFPDKPLMTPGREFTEVVTGYESETHTSPGFMAEAYWNGGWWLVVLVCLYVGVVLAGFTQFVRNAIGANRYEYLPIAMIGISMGYSPDSWFAATYVGSLAQVVGLYVVLRILVAVIARTLLGGPGQSTAGQSAR